MSSNLKGGRIERLECTVKNYAWGKHGEQSEVARLFAAGHEQHKIGKNMPYAELWIGTHPDGPAMIRSKNIHLSEHIADEEDSAAENIHLPFIMKIMSIQHTLSLQVHPTKEQAAWLNCKDPANYPDQNHKPELAYALTRFELLCGFRPMNEIVQNMKAFPELCQAMGTANCKQFIELSKQYTPESAEMIDALRKCFTNMLNIDKENVQQLLISLQRRIHTNAILPAGTVEVMKDMLKRFPNDIGCMSPLFLNHIVLEPGECVYYGAQELHAYLSGECVECVSCSNNTIRSGLTTKFVDKENLIDVLNYRMVDPSEYYVHPRRLKLYPCVQEYDPDCDDFTLHALEIPDSVERVNKEKEGAHVDLPALGCSSTFVLVQADRAVCIELNRNGNIVRDKFDVKRGDIFYIPPFHTMRFVSTKGPVKGFRTFSYEAGPDHTKRILAKKATVTAMCLQNTEEILLSADKNTLNIYDIETEMDGFL